MLDFKQLQASVNETTREHDRLEICQIEQRATVNQLTAANGELKREVSEVRQSEEEVKERLNDAKEDLREKLEMLARANQAINSLELRLQQKDKSLKTATQEA